MHSQGMLLNMSAGVRGRWRACSLHTRGTSSVSKLQFATVFLMSSYKGLQLAMGKDNSCISKLYVAAGERWGKTPAVFLNCILPLYFSGFIARIQGKTPAVFLNCMLLLYFSGVAVYIQGLPTVFLSCILPLYFSGVTVYIQGAPAVRGEFSGILSLGSWCSFEWRT